MFQLISSSERRRPGKGHFDQAGRRPSMCPTHVLIETVQLTVENVLGTLLGRKEITGALAVSVSEPLEAP